MIFVALTSLGIVGEVELFIPSCENPYSGPS